MLFLLRSGTSVSPIWTPQWELVGWREGLFPGQLDRCLGCRPSPVPGQGSTTGWAVVTSRSWEWSPEYGPCFFTLTPTSKLASLWKKRL